MIYVHLCKLARDRERGEILTVEERNYLSTDILLLLGKRLGKIPQHSKPSKDTYNFDKAFFVEFITYKSEFLVNVDISRKFT